MTVKELEARIKELEKEVTSLKDIEAIKNLQAAYGYYLEHWMGEEIIDCFSTSPEVSATFVEGTYTGPEGIRRYFGRMQQVSPEFLHQVMQVSPIITVDIDGKNAKGRWYGYGAVSMPAGKGARQMHMSVIYEMDYIKEKGVWKIFTLRLMMHYSCPADKGWLSPEKIAAAEMPREPMRLNPDIWAEYDTEYPSGYIFPFHYKHPVTGKATSEAKRNAALNLKPNKYVPKKG
jgi:hypothetical protein